MIAVVGATGNTGRAVVRELKKLGHDPVCVVRNPDKAREVLGADTKIAVAELTDRNALEKALQGAESAFLVTGPNPNMVEQESNVLDAALKAGTKYLVHVSAVSGVAKRNSEAVVGRSHYAIEEKLRSCGIGWVILRPSLFMQNIIGQSASIKDDGKMVLPFAHDLPLALTDVRDTGAVGARILVDPAAHAGNTYEVTGALTTYAAFAEVFSQVLGRDHLCQRYVRASRAGDESAQHAGLARHPSPRDRQAGSKRRVLNREHQAHYPDREARATHNAAVCRGPQEPVRVIRAALARKKFE